MSAYDFVTMRATLAVAALPTGLAIYTASQAMAKHLPTPPVALIIINATMGWATWARTPSRAKPAHSLPNPA